MVEMQRWSLANLPRRLLRKLRRKLFRRWGLYKIQSVTSSPLLKDLGSQIVEILHASGAAGASVGILDGRTKKSHLAGYGERDEQNGQAPNDQTLFHLASLSKFFTALAIALLVSDNKLSYDSKMHEVLPGFYHFSDEVNYESTIMDFLSHRTGLASKNALWQQDGHELLLKANDTISMVSYLDIVHPLGKQWTYNNFCYDILANVIEHVSGHSWGQFINKRIITPMGLHDTTTDPHPQRENYAQGYMPGPKGELTDVGRPVIGAGTCQQASNGVKSTVKDLLIFYSTIWSALKDTTGSMARSKGLPGPKILQKLFEPQILLNPDQYGQSYGAGWAIAELPAPLGSIGTNPMFVERMPLVGRGCVQDVEGNEKRKNQGPTVWYHNGSLVGFFSSVHILPGDGTIIVVLVNSIPKNDAADWIGQLILEKMLDCPSATRNDYISLARESAACYDRMWKTLLKDFRDQRARQPRRLTRPIADFAGQYFNKPRTFYIDVLHDENGSLGFRFQGRDSQWHKLEPYGIDSFSWLLTETQSRKKGRWPDLDVATYIFHFGIDKGNHTLKWEHDPDVPGGEIFVKIDQAVLLEETHDEL